MSGEEPTWSIGPLNSTKTTPCKGEIEACPLAAARARKEERIIAVYRDGLLYCYYDETGGLHWD